MSDPQLVTDAAAELPADYAALHGEALKRLHAMIALPAHNWEQRSNEGGISISLILPPGSPHVMVRTEAVINMPPERVFAFYMLEKNMRRWAPHVKMRDVVVVSPAASVQHAAYPMPAPLDNRDVVIYRASLPGEATRLPGCVRAAMAVSIDHDLAGPPAKGWVRAEVIISSTCFVAVPGHANRTRVVSYNHADPRGRIPPALVARSVGQGSEHMRAVRDDLNVIAAMEARMAAKQ